MELVQIYSSTSSMIKNHRPWLNSSIQPKTLWMQKMQSLPRRGKEQSEWKRSSHVILNKALVQNRPGWERRMIETTRRQVHLQDEVCITRPWMFRLIKCLCRSRTTHPWSGQRRWREILICVIRTSIVASIEITGMTRTNAMTWSNRIRISSGRESWRSFLDEIIRMESWKGR